MAIRDDLIQALSDSIDRLNNGEDLEVILASYPDLANQLRPMLEAGLLFPRARFAPTEVQTAQDAIEPAVQQTIRTVFGGGWNSSLFGLLFVIVMGGGLLLAVTQLNPSDDNPSFGVDVTPSITDIVPSSTPTLDATDTMSPTETDTLTPLPPTITTEPDITHTVPATPPHTPTDTPVTVTPALSDTRIVIQGPIDAITSDTIIIFNQAIDVLPDDPLLQVMQIGDIVRVEGERTTSESISLIDVDFINVTVVMFDGEIWRGDDCAVPPPDWAEDDATEWLIACTSNPSQSSNFSNPPQNNSSQSSSGQSSNNNDDDDDDRDNDNDNDNDDDD